MALTIDILKNNPLLAALAPEVLAAINTLSVNDETNVVKAAKAEVTSGIWNAVDADLKTLTGKDKPAGVKTYDWLKTSGNGGKFEFKGESFKKEDEIGIAVRKGDDLKDKFNVALAEILADGTYEKINAKYFPFSIY